MKNLYAPWRASYLAQNPKKRNVSCVFCQKLTNLDAIENLVFYKNEHCAALLNRFPYSPGHLLIIPLQHLSQLQQLDSVTFLAMWRLKQQLINVLHKLCAPVSIEIGFNLGAAAGAGIPGHLHEHLVPRYPRDTELQATEPHKPLDLLQFKQMLSFGMQQN